MCEYKACADSGDDTVDVRREKWVSTMQVSKENFQNKRDPSVAKSVSEGSQHYYGFQSIVLNRISHLVMCRECPEPQVTLSKIPRYRVGTSG